MKEQPLNIINDNNTNFKDEIKKIRPLHRFRGCFYM